MTDTLPQDYATFKTWTWADYEPRFQELLDRTLSEGNVGEWLADWSALHNRINETYARLYVAKTQNTADKDVEKAYFTFIEEVLPKYEPVQNALKRQFLDSGLNPEGFETSRKAMAVEAEIFREENVPLRVEERKLGSEFGDIDGAQTVEWDGQEVTLVQLRKVYQDQDRATRQKAWELASERGLQDRAKKNEIWVKLLNLRHQLAQNTGLENFRDLHWKQLRRFDYTPEDCATFHEAIEQTAVPAASRIYKQRMEALGVDTLRPWDLLVDPHKRPPLQPYTAPADLPTKTRQMFQNLDPELGGYFGVLQDNDLLDLENRKNKAPGGYCTGFAVAQQPFIFMNAVGRHTDVQTLLHEAGHTFHEMETRHLPYHQQGEYTMEIAEVASMAMELLVAPYFEESKGGFYSAEDAARAQAEHLEKIILFWPYMAVVDAFQHWAYTNVDQARDPANCDAAWRDLSRRFQPEIDYSGYEDEEVTGWHRKHHIFRVPFYYVEYGLAQLGSVQIWRNSLEDPAKALAQYRQALALGSTKPLPELYAAAGAKFAFDAELLGEMVSLIEEHITRLEASA